MKLTPKLIKFLEKARSTDGDGNPRDYILLSPKHKAIISADGFRLHAIRNSDNTTACLVSFHEGKPVIQANYDKYPPLNKTLNGFNSIGSLCINPDFLMDAIKDADGMIRIEILFQKEDAASVNNKEKNSALRIFSYVEGVPAFALIMGMYQSEQDKEDGELMWSPAVEEKPAESE